MGDLAGRVAVVTGAASGIGAASAAELAARGAKVVVADVNEAGAEEVAAAIASAGAAAIAVAVELAEEDVDRRTDARNPRCLSGGSTSCTTMRPLRVQR